MLDVPLAELQVRLEHEIFSNDTINRVYEIIDPFAVVAYHLFFELYLEN
jgi:hypothetical protein